MTIKPTTPVNTNTTMSSRELIYLAFLTLFWGVNWPVMKFAVMDYPPLTFRVISMLGGLLSLGLMARWQKIPLHVERSYWKQIFFLSVPNMILWHIFAISGVVLLSSGRAGILGYTMPVFALGASWWLEKKRPSAVQFLGVGLALAATLLLLSSEFAQIAGAPLGVLFMLIAAAGWGYGTVTIRRCALPHATLTLTFWMLAIATVAVGIGAVALEHAHWRWPNTGEWLSIAFNAFIVFGFCHTVWYAIARRLSPIASAISVMFIPVIGVFSGAWLLNETLYWQDYAAIGLVCASIAVVVLPSFFKKN